jgi:hypothetical protein
MIASPSLLTPFTRPSIGPLQLPRQQWLATGDPWAFAVILDGQSTQRPMCLLPLPDIEGVAIMATERRNIVDSVQQRGRMAGMPEWTIGLR